MTNNFRVSVVGAGAVGQAIAAHYENVKIFDKYQPRDSIREAAARDFIFVAVPTPFGSGQDLTEMNDAIANIVKHLVNPAQQIIIVKSTVLPGTTERYQDKYPEVNFIFNPEFLTEKTAVSDFAHPDKQLVGYTAKTKHLAEKVMDMLPPAPYQNILPATPCEIIKYAVNSYYAFKVIFGNQLYDLCQAMGIDYGEVREGLTADSRIIDSHFEIFEGGYRGFGGKCLPKDVKSFAAMAREQGVDLNFIDTILEINESLRENEPEREATKATPLQVHENS